MITPKKIGFDSSHNNKLVIESNAFSDFIQYLFNSDFKVGKIEAGLNYDKLSVYDLFVIGVPSGGAKISAEEIETLLKYIKNGGSVLIINDKGGDYENKSNLNELSKNFGIIFNSDRLFDSQKFSKENSRPIITEFKSHFITREIKEFVYSNGCTLQIIQSIETKDQEINTDVNAIAFSSKDTASHVYFNENKNDWVVESVQKIAIIAVAHYGLGKVVALGNLSIFSSLEYSYGVRAADNFKLIANIFSWLLNKASTEEEKKTLPIFLTVPLEQDLYYWVSEKIKEGKWKNIEDLINFAVKIVKLRMKQEKD